MPVAQLEVPSFVTNVPTALGDLKDEKIETETPAAGDDDESENLRKLRKINFKRKLSGTKNFMNY